MFNRRYTFESLVKGTSNQEACDAAQRIFDISNPVHTPIILIGDYATGKTHLMHAIGNKIEETRIVQHPFYCSWNKLRLEINDAIENHTIEKLCQQYSAYDILLIDGIQDTDKNQIEQDVFFCILDDAHRNNRQIVLSVDAVDDNVISNKLLQKATIIELKSPNEIMRIEILRRYMREENIPVDDELIAYIHATCSDMNIKD